jgi:gluconokinase
MIVVLIGVSGSGKTSVGKALSTLTGWSFLDADDYHSEVNIAKMSRGEPLNDEDRAGWLEVLSEVIQEQIEKGEETILACSALKKVYRSQLSQADPQAVHFVYLKVSTKLLQARLEQRQNHFMKTEMLRSQLGDLEEPKTDEALIVKVQTETSPEVIAVYIQNKLSAFQHLSK